MTSNEYFLLKQCHREFLSPILEVGSLHSSNVVNPRKLFDDEYEYFGVDIQEGKGVDLVHDMEKPLTKEAFNTVICCSVLEHTKRPWIIAENIEKALCTGGYLFVSAPHSWRYHRYPEDYWRFSHSAFEILFPNIEWKFIKYAGMKRKAIFDTYLELSNTFKQKMIRGTTATAMVIGLGVKK